MMPTPTDLLTGAQRAGESARRYAADADRDRRLRPEVVDALVEAGFTSCLVPRAHGGTSTTFAELTRAVAEVAEGCPSAAWIASLWAYTSRFAAYLPAEGQGEVWSKGPGTRLVSALAPSGAATPVSGGWRLSGSWSYTSGIDFSDWALVVAPATSDEGATVRFFAVPRDEYAIKDTWLTMGMRATGSHSLMLDEVFVPAHRAFSRDDMFAGRNAVSDDPRHQVPLRAVNGLTFAAPLLGAARAALGAVAELQAGGSARRGGQETAHVAFARAAGEIDASGMLLERAADVADSGTLTGELMARAGRDCTLAVEMLVGAVDRLLVCGGTRGLSETHALQRLWRDVHAAASHVALQFHPAAVAYARERFAA